MKKKVKNLYSTAIESLILSIELFNRPTNDEATPTQSYYLLCKALPSSIKFGVNGGPPQFVVNLNKNQ